MQTILGASGTVGIELTKALKSYTDQIRIVSRNPVKTNDSYQLFPADLTNSAQVDKAIAGSEVVYITIGFQYKLSVWRANWPKFMKDVIESCKKHHAKLVFFDNVYMYDPSEIPHMTESSRINPSSKKGKIRAEIAQMLMSEVEKGTLTALIARSADFYGPNCKNSVSQIILDNFKKGKKGMWLADASKNHNFTYTPDAGIATALLGNTPDAYNQVWHLPTSREKLTGKQWIEAYAKAMNVKPGIQVLPVWMMGILGIFIPIMKELKEMAYQNDRDYFFDSSKFEERFNFKPTLVNIGIQETVKSYI